MDAKKATLQLIDGQPPSDSTGDLEQLFHSDINSDADMHPIKASYVRFSRDPDGPIDSLSALANLLWTPLNPNSSIGRLGDILTVALHWSYNGRRELWRLDETLVLGAYRGNGSLSQG